MTIYSERLQLRPVAAADVDDVWRIYGDPATHLFNPRGPLAAPENAAQLVQQWLLGWHQEGFGEFAISLKSAPSDVIGFAGIKYRQTAGKSYFNLGYRLMPAAWGSGYASECTARLLWFGFASLKLNRISAIVRPSHTASRRVLEKNGLQHITTIDDLPGVEPSLLYQISHQRWRQIPEQNISICSQEYAKHPI